MNLPRRSFLSWVSGLFVAAFSRADAQTQLPSAQPPQAEQPSQPAQNPLLARIAPYQAVENATSVMKPDDVESVRAVVEAIFNVPRIYQIPEILADVAKQRLMDAQIAYLRGKTAGAQEASVVDALNTLAIQFELPEYGMVSLLQVQVVRVSLGSLMPVFMHSDSGPEIALGEPNPPMSPLQAIVTAAGLIDRKLGSPDYQVPPAEWDRDVYPRLAEQERAAQEYRRRIAAGKIKPQLKARLTFRVIGPDNLLTIVRRGISSMSLADGLKRFDQTFAQLGI
jgi:hypothetical protein